VALVAALAVATAGCGNSAPNASNNQSASHQSSSGSDQPGGAGAGTPIKLIATVEASGDTTLTTEAGRPVTRMRSGWYTVFVRVNAVGADFHLTGPSVDSVTKSKIPGVALWGIHFKKGAYHYMNDHDAHAQAHALSVY
jgi:hypothetical protein